MKITTGDTVRPSESEIRKARDYWLNQGRAELKESARVELQRRTERRGTVTGIREGKFATIYSVQWNDGGTSECLSSVIQKA